MKKLYNNDTKIRLLSRDRDCEKCSSQQKCLAVGLDPEQVKSLGGIIRYHATFEAGEAIFKVEDRFDSLFAIQSGAVKIQTYGYDGANLVSGFYFPGDLIGIESIGDSAYRNDAIALCSTTVCKLPFDRLEALCDSIPLLRGEVMARLVGKIQQTNQVILHGRHLHAEAKVLLFLRYLCRCNDTWKYDGGEVVKLSMSKGDIACYLGLRPESLSRALTKLQSEGIIRNHAKSIDLLDTETHVSILCGH